MTKLNYTTQQRAFDTLQDYLANRADLGPEGPVWGESDPEGRAVAAARAIRAAFAELEREEDERSTPTPESAHLDVLKATNRKLRADIEKMMPHSNLEQADSQELQPWISALDWGLCYWPRSSVSGRMLPYRFIGVHGQARGAWSIAIIDCEDLRKRGDDRPRMRVQFGFVMTAESLAKSSHRADLEQLAERSWITVMSSREEVRQSAMDLLAELVAQGSVDAIGADPWVLSTELQEMGHRGWPSLKCSGSSVRMSEAAWFVVDAVRWETLIHHGNPVIEHMLVQTVAHKASNGRILPAERDTGCRIDGPLALVKAVQVALQHFQNDGEGA